MNGYNIGYQLGKLFRSLTGMSCTSSELEKSLMSNIGTKESNASDGNIDEIQVFEEYRSGDSGYGWYSADGDFLGDEDTYMNISILDESA